MSNEVYQKTLTLFVKFGYKYSIDTDEIPALVEQELAKRKKA